MSAPLDPFGTAAIRAATLSAWTGSPTRLREDANLEDDHVRGYYRDRVIVELAQNAADAALAAPALAAVALTPSATGIDDPSTPPPSTAPPGPGPGRLLLRLTSDEGGPLLIAANTGGALTPEGVLALASMRASAKSGPGSATAVGRFGVGFSAVRAVSDEITIASAHGGVRFSAAATRGLLTTALGDLTSADTHQSAATHNADTRSAHAPTAHAPTAHAPAAHPHSVQATIRHTLDRPAEDLPILRLPIPVAPTEVTLPPGYDTAVVVRLRSPQVRSRVHDLLAEVDDVLLLALPALGEIRVEIDGELPRVTRDVGERWLTVRASGVHDAADLADRPHEERARTGWSVTWALPRRAVVEPLSGPGAPGALPTRSRPEPLHGRHVVHAPTPTDEPCTVPALLIATFPLDPSRRHVAPGQATDAVVEQAGHAYAELLARAAADGADPLPLVPVGFPLGRLDAGLHAAALDALRDAPILTPAAPSATLLVPREAQAIAGPVGHDARAVRALADALPGLVVTPHGPDAHARLRALGVEPRPLADVIDSLPTSLDADALRALYDALAPHAGEPTAREALAGLPVPLADGRTVRGPRGLVILPGPAERGVMGLSGFSAAHNPAFGGFGLRVVHPDAAHPLLVTLGATESDARALLGHPAVRAAVAASVDPPDPEITDATLALVRAALDDGAAPAAIAAAYPWLADLLLTDDDGDPTPARDLALPGSWAARHLTGLAPLESTWVERYPPETLQALGVRTAITTVRIPDVVADPEADPDPEPPAAYLDGWPDYLDHLAATLGPGAYVGEITAVADLDAVDRNAWPAVLRAIAADQAAREALLAEVRSGGRAAPSYTAWWLREEFGAPFAAPGARVPFLPPAPPELRALPDDDGAAPLDQAVLRAVGAVDDLANLDAAAWADYLDALPPVGTEVPLADALTIWRALAHLALSPLPPDTWLDRSSGRTICLTPRSARGMGGAGAAEPRAAIAPMADVAVAANPMWSQVRDVIPAPPEAAEALADLLGADLLRDTSEPDSTGPESTAHPTPPAVRELLPTAPPTYTECDEITVDGVDVTWWVGPPRAEQPGVTGPETPSTVYAATTAGLARALAQAAGRWDARHAVEILLADPTRSVELTTEHAWDGGSHRSRDCGNGQPHAAESVR